MRQLKPVSLNVKNIGRDGKKATVSIPLKVDFGRQPEKSTQEINKEIDSPEEQDQSLFMISRISRPHLNSKIVF